MKIVLGFATFIVVFGCGIMNLIFDLPERYIERDVKIQEMVGTWNITAQSETDVNKFLKDFPGWGASAPWKTITLNSDGTCMVQLEIKWLRDENEISTEFPRDPIPEDVKSNNITSCAWNLAKEKNLSNKISPIVEFDIEYPNRYGMKYSLYIYEENNKLILWNFIGDADDFLPQDFMKTGQ